MLIDEHIQQTLRREQEEQRQAIKEMAKLCLPILGKELCDKAEEISLYLTKEEFGHYKQGEKEGQKMFFNFVQDYKKGDFK